MNEHSLQDFLLAEEGEVGEVGDLLGGERAVAGAHLEKKADVASVGRSVESIRFFVARWQLAAKAADRSANFLSHVRAKRTCLISPADVRGLLTSVKFVRRHYTETLSGGAHMSPLTRCDKGMLIMNDVRALAR